MRWSNKWGVPHLHRLVQAVEGVGAVRVQGAEVLPHHRRDPREGVRHIQNALKSTSFFKNPIFLNRTLGL